MHARTVPLTVVIIAALLTSCAGGGNQQETTERATVSTVSESPDSGTVVAGKPDTDLAVGDTFTFFDGVKVGVAGIRAISRYGKLDERPGADEIFFRVTFTVTNGTSEPYDLNRMGREALGAATGGETEVLYVSVDSKPMNGLLAPGRSGTFTDEYAIAKSDGSEVVFTVNRFDDGFYADPTAWFGEDPHWTGRIE